MSDDGGILVKVRGNAAAMREGLSRRAGFSAVEVEPLLSLPSRGMGVAGDGAATWMRLRGFDDPGATPWDRAHALLAEQGAFGLEGDGGIELIEPDLAQQWPTGGPPSEGMAAATEPCAFDGQTASGGRAAAPGNAWNLGEGYSQLALARAAEGAGRVILAHLDTGFDPDHATRPAHLLTDLARNFVRGQDPTDATDRIPPGTPLTNRGHGTATLALLAGRALPDGAPGWEGFTGPIGGAPQLGVVPVRVADWVVRFSTGTLVQGFGHATEIGAHVLSMSMGGVASQALADAVNLAYERGLLAVTAAGNHFAGFPTPRSIVYPARFRRVLAACGVMADGRAYYGLATGTMQGNHGPASKMDTALGAFTPNVPWAQIGCPEIVDMDGEGTSAATPQIAAAAALWLDHHWERVSSYSEPWMRVEAARHALFASAAKWTRMMDREATLRTIGQGVMRAADALQVAPLPESRLRELWLPPARSTYGWLDGLFGGGVSLAPGQLSPREAMLALELTQMAQRIARVEAAIDDPDRPEAEPAAVHRYLEAALEEGNPSAPLRALLLDRLGRRGDEGPRPPAPPPASPTRRRRRDPVVPDRRLRIFALDPSLGHRLESVAVNETVLRLPWDDSPVTAEPLRPGPVGDYLEVVDIDPASNRLYEPVDLKDPLLLAQDGWPPSEGNPQFHQQMVYAVAMATIRNFEQALGRRALWAPRIVRGQDDHGQPLYRTEEVRRLRLHPHAFRGANAYYSPQKKAVLFGYFPAASGADDATAAGSMVFTCLSSDIIAHEMSHALLDGLDRRLQEASNPDVPAFHEAFADIVALFQHFDMPELLRFEIGRVRGNVTAARLLGGLARQFGEGASRGGPLRDYNDPKMRELRYRDSLDAHTRGSILVYAVYEAFLAIVGRRVGDLLRLATNGTGILPEGALHPELVDRLAAETAKTARHVLRVCLRALDYLPPVDITFGEYLRALITADLDLVPEDSLGYRTAFMESFRNRGILPAGVRSVSEESLAWDPPEEARPDWLAGLLDGLDLRWDQAADRSALFRCNERNRWTLHRRLEELFTARPDLCRSFGLQPGIGRFDPQGRLMREAPPGSTTFEVHSIRPARRVAPDGTFRTDVIAVLTQRQPIPLDGRDIANGFFWFRGGATLVMDSRPGAEALRYLIVKNSDSAARRSRQQELALEGSDGDLRRLYFGPTPDEPFALLHEMVEGPSHG